MIHIALQVWMPLNGNLNNQGINNTAFTGSTTFEAGKIGQAGVFGTNAKRAISSATVTLNSQVTIAFWIKIKTWVNWGRIFNLYNSDKTNGISCCSNASTDKRIGTQVYKNETKLTDSYNGSFDLNTWYHFTMVINGTTKQHYINGSLVGTATLSDSMVTTDYTVMCGGNSDGGTPVDMDINDFRVYDHALSPNEIEILSRGLVLHYPLSLSGKNLLINTIPISTGSWAVAGSGWTNSVVNEPSSPTQHAMKCTYTGSGGTQGGTYHGTDKSLITNGESYTLSAWIRASKDCTVYFYNEMMSGQKATSVTTEWKRYSFTGVVNTSASYSANICYVASGSVTTNMWIEVAGMKLEMGDKPTPWIPHTSDTGYSTVVLSSTTEYDVSGYNYHGARTNITYSSDTARYSTSSVFNGSSSRIYCGTINLGNIWSYGMWYKSASVSSNWQAVALLNTSGGDTDLQLGFYTCHSESRLQSSANGKYNAQISLPHDTNWHHFFATYDGSSLKTYMDGALVNTTSITAALLARSNLTLGARCGNASGTSFNTWFTGQLSDFRLYATVLSATQIQELYNTSASISNNGVLMGYELVEQ